MEKEVKSGYWNPKYYTVYSNDVIDLKGVSVPVPSKSIDKKEILDQPLDEPAPIPVPNTTIKRIVHVQDKTEMDIERAIKNSIETKLDEDQAKIKKFYEEQLRKPQLSCMDFICDGCEDLWLDMEME